MKLIRSQRFWMAVCAVIFAASAVWCVLILTKPARSAVRIVQDGKELFVLDLSVTEDKTMTVEFEGRRNVLEIKDGRIRMLEADCPDKVCIHTGWLTTDIPIVCLPNRLVIEFADSRVDAAVG